MARLWDVCTHRRIASLSGHVGIVGSVAVSPDGRTLATTGNDRTVRRWDLRAHGQLALLTGHTGVLCSALFAPDGNTISTSGDDGTVRLWDTDAFNDPATQPPSRPSLHDRGPVPDRTGNGAATFPRKSRTTGDAQGRGRGDDERPHSAPARRKRGRAAAGWSRDVIEARTACPMLGLMTYATTCRPDAR
ncbi:WD40 repeat domain-containing protein [Streptomyces sp. DH41]|uniref:WD40 repeat domain-containing protein n=1 Tax=Streptomyces sp. DH41 TaxID=3040125 RepID=UPI003FA78897